MTDALFETPAGAQHTPTGNPAGAPAGHTSASPSTPTPTGLADTSVPPLGGRAGGTDAAGLLQGPAHSPAALVIEVFGKPITQGSKVKGRYGMWDDNAKTLKPWRDNVRSAALEYSGADSYERIDGPVAVSIVFTFDRPAIHWRTGRNAHLLREGAPAWPTNVKSGDIDKLQRSCFDSLTDAGVWRDDAQVVHVHAAKVYVGSGNSDALDRPGAVIRVQAMPA